MKAHYLKHVAVLVATCLSASAHAIVLSDPSGSGRSLDLTVSGSAAWVLSGSRTYEPATGVLPYSQFQPYGGALGFNQVASGQTAGIEGAAFDTVVRDFGRINSQGQYRIVSIPTAASLQAGVSGGAVNEAGQVSEYGLSGGVRWQVPYNDAVAYGGLLEITNLRVDLDSKMVRADVLGRELLYDNSTNTEYLGPQERRAGVSLWTFDQAVGPRLDAARTFASPDILGNLRAAGFSDAAMTGAGQLLFSGSLTLTGLKMHSEAGSLFEHYFGLVEGGTGFNVFRSVNDGAAGWGDLTMTIQYATAVPEPATSAYMLFGVAVLAAWSRRRTRSCVISE